MKSPTLSPRDVRDMDRTAAEQYGLPTRVLMENAGAECARALWNETGGQPGRVTLLAGKGNNGGDALVMARHLDAFGVEVHVVTWWPPEEMTPDAAANWQVLQQAGFSHCQLPLDASVEQVAEQLAGSQWIVDGMLGIGIEGPPRSPIREALEAVSGSPQRQFCIDWPTGVSCATGQPCSPHPIRAELTCTLVAPKQGQADLPQYCGRLVIGNIGLPRQLLAKYLGR